MLAQVFLRVNGQAQILKHYFLRVNTTNIQSLSADYLMRQQVHVVFLLLLVDQSAVAYIFDETNLSPCWRKDILRVKGRALITNCNFHEFVRPIRHFVPVVFYLV